MNSVSRVWAILLKELIQMRRDRMTFAMMVAIPIMQLILFGFAINTDPKRLPTVIYAQENTSITRAIIDGFAHSNYFHFIDQVDTPKAANDALLTGDASFVIQIPVGFTRELIRQQHPQLLIEADASDPSASSNALAQATKIVESALVHEYTGALAYLKSSSANIDVVIHRKYNPEGITQYNIVPGLLGVILTMTSVMITAMAMTRESEKGNLENILAMPARPFEVMLGKITPYVLVGSVQTVIILLAATWLFTVPFVGNIALLLMAVLVFIIANLFLGFTFSTIAKTQMQAMQMTFFFFLPSILLSGFMFPFRGMPLWAQYAGEVLPLTHFLRIVRGVMLKGADWSHLHQEFYAMFAFIFFAGLLSILRYRTTLD
ncbi:ABC transporter permease [Thalassotalea sediminis]|uniref:ABC transporter permease n=1 Tax=Thalassotalea sediminis TaxID=1759089 RepID=UPI0025744B32|nr:ABC transporter permease [Thalassotalea sediminis]